MARSSSVAPPVNKLARVTAAGRSASPRRSVLVAAALSLLLLVASQPAAAAAPGSLFRPVPKILSASWGTDDAVGCPNGAQELDNIPVTFSWFVRRGSIQ